MSLAWISLGALMITIVVSCTTTVNAGLLAVVLAWLIGVYVAPLCGATIGFKAVVAGFPGGLFLTLLGVTLLFSCAQVNGTLDRVARVAIRSCRGNVGLMPLLFFGLALAIAAVGAGNIAAAALVGPMAMAVAGRAGVPAFLMTIMVAHGAVAGALSPIAPTGLIASDIMRRIGLGGHERETFVSNLLANLGVALAGYVLFGGLRLFAQRYDEAIAPTSDAGPDANKAAPVPCGAGDSRLEFRHGATLAVISALVVGAVFFEVEVGPAALAGAVLLTLMRCTDEQQAVRVMPWSVLIMVCGVTVLTALLEKTGGIDLFSSLIAQFSTPRSVTGVIALATGVVSVYSSTSGVVLPAFLPAVPDLVDKLGGGDALAIASSINVGGHLVDVSPLSTIGALCVASAPATEDRRRLFNKVLGWGLTMSLVGAAICYVAFGPN
jgi:di/tricarboxylate transporter